MITFCIILKSLAPSTIAASIKALGIWSTNCFTKNKPTGIAIRGKICASQVLIKPVSTITMYLGTATAVATNIRAIWLILNSAPFNLKFFLEKA